MGKISVESDYQIFSHPDRHLWCACPIQDSQGKYHLFYSSWSKDKTHDAWVTHSQISRAISDEPTGPWEDCGKILPKGDVFDRWDSEMAHNPHVLESGGRYFLYYTGTSGSGFWKDSEEVPSMNHPEWWVNRNAQRIGVLVANHPVGPWQSMDEPLINPPKGYRLSATPCVIHRNDGRFQMVFKAVEEDSTMRGGNVRHFVALSDHPLGPFHVLKDPFIANTRTAFPIDDHVEWFQDGSYWCLAKDHGENFVGEEPCLLLFRSKDGFSWELFEPAFAIPFHLRNSSGETVFFDRLEMPKILFENGIPSVLYLAAKLKDKDESFSVQIKLV